MQVLWMGRTHVVVEEQTHLYLTNFIPYHDTGYGHSSGERLRENSDPEMIGSIMPS